jgi:hypothetical protein
VTRALPLLLLMAASRCGDAPRSAAPQEPAPTPPVETAGAAVPIAPHETHARGTFVQSDAEPYDFALEPASIELGVLRPDEDARCEFEIVNRDARPLKLINVDGSCVCVGFDWVRGDLPPGGRRKVAVVVRAEQRGNRQLTAFVQAHDRAVTTHEVAIRYVVEPDLRFEPPRADFGARVVGSDGRLDLLVSYQLPAGATPLTFAPRLVAGPPPQPDVALPVSFEFGTPVSREEAGGLLRVEQSLRLVLDATAPADPFKGELLFDGPGHRKARLAVSGAVHGGAWLDPAELHLGVAAVGKARRGTVRLRWLKDAVEVDSISCSAPGLSATSQAEEGARSLKIQVELTPTAAGDFAGDVTIQVKGEPRPLLLHVRAKVR